jgi:hypothetical protein
MVAVRGGLAHKKKPALAARAKNFQGVVLQRRTAFIVLPDAYRFFARAQYADN